MKTKQFLILAILLLSKLSLTAQTINGKIIAAKTSEAIPHANIELTPISPTGSPKLTSTDTLGFFEFSRLTPGKYNLAISAIGFQKTNKEIVLSENLTLGDIPLAEDLQQLKMVTIDGARPNFSTQDGQQKIQVAGNALLKSSINLLDVLQKTPGIQVNPDGTIIMGNRNTPAFFIDGKPSNMNPTEMLAYLNSLSPEIVESIALINQPSSKYDGEFKAIIDIKLKRSLVLGLRGTYTLRFQQNQNTLLDNTATVNYKTKRFMYGLNLGYTNGEDYYHYHALQYLSNGNGMTTETERITSNNNLAAQFRVVHEISKNQELEGFLRTYQVSRKMNTANELLTQTPDLKRSLALIRSNNDALPQQYNYAAGFIYDLKLPKQDFRLQGTLANIDNRQSEDIQNNNTFTNVLENHWITKARNKINIRNIQADYTWTISDKAKFEMGTKFAYTRTQNNLRYDTLAATSFVYDAQRSNEFDYQEYISAVYVSYAQQWDKLKISFGLRAEHTHSLANSISTALVTTRNYLKWLPNLGITYALNKDQQLHLNWSNRLTRPVFEQLNPFRFYFSPRNYWIGNPYLLPSTTNQLALTYSRKSFNISISAGREKDQMARYPIYNATTHELAFLGDNLPYRDFAAAQASLPIRVSKWWTMNHSTGLFYNRELRNYLDQSYQIAIYNYTINGNHVFTLNKWLLDFGYNYESKSGNSLYIFAPIFTVNLGLQRSWFNNKLNTKLNINDIFDEGQRRLIFREKTIINNDFYHDAGAQRLVFSINYAFGKSTFNAKENKRSEEENRANRP